MDDGAKIDGPSSGGKIYERRAEDFVFPDWLQSSRDGKGVHGYSGREDLCVESYELFRCCGVDDGAGSSLSICSQDGSDGHAVHRDVSSADGALVI